MIWIRIASVIALLQGLAHGALVLLATPRHGPAEVMVVRVMKEHVFDFAGADRSYWDMYFGYALMAAGVCFVEAALLWLLGPLARRDPRSIRPVIGLIVFANAAHAILIWRYFFYVPLVPDLAIVVILSLAILSLRSTKSGEAPSGDRGGGVALAGP